MYSFDSRNADVVGGYMRGIIWARSMAINKASLTTRPRREGPRVRQLRMPADSDNKVDFLRLQRNPTLISAESG